MMYTDTFMHPPYFVHLTSTTALKTAGSTNPTNPVIADGELQGRIGRRLCVAETLCRVG